MVQVRQEVKNVWLRPTQTEIFTPTTLPLARLIGLWPDVILFGVSDSTCLHKCVSFTVWIKHLWWRYGRSHKQEKHPSETSEGVKSCLECLESLRFAFYVHSTFILRILTSPDSAMSRPQVWEPRRGQRRCGHWHGREQPPARCPWLQVTLCLTRIFTKSQQKA